MKYLILPFVFLGFCIACEPAPQSTSVVVEEPHPLLGSWEMRELHFVSADTTVSVTPAQPGLFLLTEDHYAFMWTPTREARVPFEVLAQPTDEEILTGFRSVVFNAGTYSLSDSLLTTTAQIAKVPGFEGGIQYFNFDVADDRLELTRYDETYPDGTKPAWSGTWQTRFVMERGE